MLKDKRVVFIFDECHRSQFGENHKAIKEFFPKAQLFGFTGTPIFEENATYSIREGEYASYVTTSDVFEKQLHAYTITHAIEDKNVLRFHVDYYKGKGSENAKPGEAIAQQAVVEAILTNNAATNYRKYNALLATASINNAIEYYQLFKEVQKRKIAEDPNFVPLQVACVFSPPANGDKDIRQIQEDLAQEREDNKKEPEKKKAALKEIIKDYNKLYGTNHEVFFFDLYYQDIQNASKTNNGATKNSPKTKKLISPLW